MNQPEQVPDCPSAQPDMLGARAFGIILGSTEAPEVAYLKAEATIDLSRLTRLHNLEPTEVFRIAAKCEESRCAHFNGTRCTLAERIIEQLPPVVDALPPCTVRSTCRWYFEQGKEACIRCPQLVTVSHLDDLRLRIAAEPPSDLA
ncbi:MAG: hypothetical protein ACLQO1_01315 [Steroidobacteraceae bacterium]